MTAAYLSVVTQKLRLRLRMCVAHVTYIYPIYTYINIHDSIGGTMFRAAHGIQYVKLHIATKCRWFCKIVLNSLEIVGRSVVFYRHHRMLRSGQAPQAQAPQAPQAQAPQAQAPQAPQAPQAHAPQARTRVFRCSDLRDRSLPVQRR